MTTSDTQPPPPSPALTYIRHKVINQNVAQCVCLPGHATQHSPRTAQRIACWSGCAQCCPCPSPGPAACPGSQSTCLQWPSEGGSQTQPRPLTQVCSRCKGWGQHWVCWTCVKESEMRWDATLQRFYLGDWGVQRQGLWSHDFTDWDRAEVRRRGRIGEGAGENGG